MIDQRSLIVGYDLNNTASQICYFNPKTYEPESICVTSDKTKYLIPTVLGVKEKTKEWVYGEEACLMNERGEGVLIDNLLNKLKTGKETLIYGVPFRPVALLEKFFRKSLQLLKIYFPSNSILKLVVTVKNPDEQLMSGIYEALAGLGIGRDRALVQSHSQSYQYYALNQKKELWLNDVGLFDFDEEGLIYQQITIDRRVKPNTVGITEKNFQDILNPKILEELIEKDKAEYLFSNLANEVLYKQIISTLYITGSGFAGDWADNVLKELCIGRRVFKGQNLYVKGACYAARELAGEGRLKSFLLLGSEMITSTFYLNGFYGGKPAEVILARAGTCWYDAKDKVDFILDDINVLTIFRQDLLKHETQTYQVPLEGLPVRPNKTTRIEVKIEFLNKNTAVITVKDKGFGKFYPSSERQWEKKITF